MRSTIIAAALLAVIPTVLGGLHCQPRQIDSFPYPPSIEAVKREMHTCIDRMKIGTGTDKGWKEDWWQCVYYGFLLTGYAWRNSKHCWQACAPCLHDAVDNGYAVANCEKHERMARCYFKYNPWDEPVAAANNSTDELTAES
ncbi:Uu.00g043330.m01.CDS01 [Anthostomella pinea]|uniref:Uu.00g043330.m01.CDS01 n=1 Tax=Anthostomella pinea TaxID=933095 RepID=A0AAI8YE70_9PEZI|nr:Uu.00g043330.m01.CDS01 [Anthostomella pinea]